MSPKAQKKQGLDWKNSIVGHAEVAPVSLVANSANPRKHPSSQSAPLVGALNEVGWIQDVIVNKRTSKEWNGQRNQATLVDGHLRVELALQHKQATVPVKYVDLTPSQEALALATFDPLSALATYDKQALDALLREVSTGDAALSQMLADLATQNGLLLTEPTVKEYDESIASTVQYVDCPACGHKFPK